MGARLNFFFTEAIRSLSTNVATSVAATLSMLVALLVVGAFLIFISFLNKTADTVQDQAGRVKVFLQETATDADINALNKELTGMPEVKKVIYVNKEDALARAKKLFGGEDSDLIKNLPGNPFPRSLEADLRNPAKVKEVANRMDERPGVKEVTYGGKTTETVISFASAAKVILAVLAVFLIIAGTMLVSNTIRLSIFARRREIEVMKLVGASNMFVRLPFMIEGFLCGVAAAVGAILLISAIGGFAEPMLRKFRISGAVHVPELSIFAMLLVMGIILGGVGSGMTIRKYLRV
jgi:cell division transport system permease protein